MIKSFEKTNVQIIFPVNAVNKVNLPNFYDWCLKLALQIKHLAKLSWNRKTFMHNRRKECFEILIHLTNTVNFLGIVLRMIA